MSATILIVDDEVHIRTLIEQTLEDLEDEGVQVVTAADGVAGLAMIEKVEPALVFLDVMMPRMNGFDVCEAAKRKLPSSQMHIVLLTAKGQEVDRQRGRDVGADAYMTKPFDPDALLAHAREVLGL